jgi:hypothetical protein
MQIIGCSVDNNNWSGFDCRVLHGALESAVSTANKPFRERKGDPAPYVVIVLFSCLMNLNL